MKEYKPTNYIYRPHPFIQKLGTGKEGVWALIAHVRINGVLKEVIVFKHQQHAPVATRYKDLALQYSASRVREMVAEYLQLKYKDKNIA